MGAQKQSPIIEDTQKIDTQINRLDSLIERLYERLSLVLKDPQPTGETNTPTPLDESRSHVRTMLQELELRLNAENQRIEGLLNRIDI